MMKHIIIGNSAAGVNAAEVIRELDKACKITIVSDEDTPCYSRCLLPNYLSGERNKEEMIIRDHRWYEKNNIKLLLGKKVLKVNDKNKEIILDSSRPVGIHYDNLLIATGSSPIFPTIKGIKNPMVFGFRAVSDVEKMLEVLPKIHNAVVLGAGLIGLKAAHGLWKRGIRVTIIEKMTHVLPRVLDQKAANIITKCIVGAGLKPAPIVKTNSTVTEIISKKDGVKGVKLENGEVIKCDLVIVAVGVKPNTDFIENTGIRRNQGILVDEYMRTNVEGIYAAGDVVETIDFLSKQRTINAIWPSATRGGKIAGYNMFAESHGMGVKKRYDANLAMNSLEFFGIPVVSMGLTDPGRCDDVITPTPCQEYEIVYSESPEQNIYKKLILRNGKIVGMVFVGDIEKAGVILSLIKRGDDVSTIKSELLSGETFVSSPIPAKFRNLLHYPITR